MQEQLLVLLGPTACGKTGVGISLAQRLDGEIVSADSVAVYHGMEIGSARPSKQEQSGVRHHLLDCVSVDDRTFSVAQYRQMATAAIQDIQSRGKLPILVGGSGLYLDAVTAPMTYVAPSDPVLREKLNDDYAASPQLFWERLRACDPITADRLHVNDRKRLVRAMEVWELTGIPFSVQNENYAKRQASSGPFSCRKFGIELPRELLYQRINMRVDAMMRDGLETEARALYEQGFPRDLPAMKSIGYAQLFSYFDGETTLCEAVDLIKMRTRQFAKRQETWFRRDTGITWLRSDGNDRERIADAIVRKWEE